MSKINFLNSSNNFEKNIHILKFYFKNEIRQFSNTFKIKENINFHSLNFNEYSIRQKISTNIIIKLDDNASSIFNPICKTLILNKKNLNKIYKDFLLIENPEEFFILNNEKYLNDFFVKEFGFNHFSFSNYSLYYQQGTKKIIFEIYIDPLYLNNIFVTNIKINREKFSSSDENIILNIIFENFKNYSSNVFFISTSKDILFNNLAVFFNDFDNNVTVYKKCFFEIKNTNEEDFKKINDLLVKNTSSFSSINYENYSSSIDIHTISKTLCLFNKPNTLMCGRVNKENFLDFKKIEEQNPTEDQVLEVLSVFKKPSSSFYYNVILINNTENTSLIEYIQKSYSVLILKHFYKTNNFLLLVHENVLYNFTLNKFFILFCNFIELFSNDVDEFIKYSQKFEINNFKKMNEDLSKDNREFSFYNFLFMLFKQYYYIDIEKNNEEYNKDWVYYN